MTNLCSFGRTLLFWLFSTVEEPSFVKIWKSCPTKKTNYCIYSQGQENSLKCINMGPTTYQTKHSRFKKVQVQDLGIIKAALNLVSGRHLQNSPWDLHFCRLTSTKDFVKTRMEYLYGRKLNKRTPNMEDLIKKAQIYWWSMATKV